MTDTEIIRSYEGAGTRKKHQITVLAQLNDCTRHEIIMRLTTSGVKITDGEYIKQCERTQEKERAELRALDAEARAAEARREGGKMEGKSKQYEDSKSKAEGRKTAEVKPDDSDRKTDSAVGKNEKTEGKRAKQAVDKLPQCVVDALMARIDILDDDMRTITKRKKELEEAMKQKEEEYTEICRFMGIGVFDA